MKTGRRAARENALQVLYQLDLNRDLTLSSALKYLEEHFEKDPSGGDFSRVLVEGVIENRKQLDERIQKSSEHWKMDRMPAVDRNILRLGVFEFLHRDDIPSTVTIDEMVELAKTFGSEETPAFVNGLLDKIASTLNNPSKAP